MARPVTRNLAAGDVMAGVVLDVAEQALDQVAAVPRLVPGAPPYGSACQNGSSSSSTRDFSCPQAARTTGHRSPPVPWDRPPRRARGPPHRVRRIIESAPSDVVRPPSLGWGADAADHPRVRDSRPAGGRQPTRSRAGTAGGRHAHSFRRPHRGGRGGDLVGGDAGDGRGEFVAGPGVDRRGHGPQLGSGGEPPVHRGQLHEGGLSAQAVLRPSTPPPGVRDAGFSADVAGTVYAWRPTARMSTSPGRSPAWAAYTHQPRRGHLDGTGGQQLPPERVVDGGVTRLRQRDALHRGAFAAVNGVKRRNLAALNPSTGAVVPSFNPAPNGLVHSIKASGSQIYVGGKFTTIGADARSYVALLDASGAVQPYNAGLAFDSQVFDIATTDTAVYLGPAGTSRRGTPSTPPPSARVPSAGRSRRTGTSRRSRRRAATSTPAGTSTTPACPLGRGTRCLVDFSARKT